jgi:hypothetical protein
MKASQKQRIGSSNVIFGLTMMLISPNVFKSAKDAKEGIMTDLSLHCFHHCLSAQHQFIKFVELVALAEKEAKTTREAIFNKWISRYGTPLEIVSDNC